LLAAALATAEDAGEPMEEAIAQAARQRGIERPAGRVVAVEPFDSERKRVSVVLESAGGDRTAYVKGAREPIAPRVTQAKDADRLERTAHDWAADGTRVLMVVERGRLAAGDDPEQSLRALGLIGLTDPPRPGARGSVELARSAGIRTS
jgi:P-type Ca2+ transporter type 2C